MNKLNKLEEQELNQISKMSTEDFRENYRQQEQILENLLINHPYFKTIDKKRTIRNGEGVCKLYAKNIELMRRIKESKDSGYLAGNSVIKTPDSVGSKQGDKILYKIAKEEQLARECYNTSGAMMSFLDLIGFIGLVSKDCETYLMLKYYYDEDNKVINEFFQKEEKLARDIRSEALLLVAFLTNKAVLI